MQELVDDYLAGMTWSKMQSKHCVSQKKIERFIEKLKIKRTNGYEVERNISPDETSKFLELYSTGFSTSAIGLLTGRSQSAVFASLQRIGFEARTRSEACSHYKLRADAFGDKFDEHALYWAGFLMADGNLSQSNYQISVGLQGRDVSHVRKFADFLKTNKPIEPGARGTKRLRINSQQLYDDLKSYGLIPRKSKTAKLSDDVSHSRHIFRGLVDGDGSLYWNKTDGGKRVYPRLTLVGSVDITNQFADFVRESIDFRPRVYENGTIFGLSICGKKASRMIKMLYGDSSVYLDRKFELSKEMGNG